MTYVEKHHILRLRRLVIPLLTKTLIIYFKNLKYIARVFDHPSYAFVGRFSMTIYRLCKALDLHGCNFFSQVPCEAAQMVCRKEQDFSIKERDVSGKQILDI